MHTILDLINDGVIETDKAGNIITLNKKGESLLRIEEKDVVGKKHKRYYKYRYKENRFQ